MQYRWDKWNREHIATHKVAPHEAEQVLDNCSEPFPWKVDEHRWLVWGSTAAGRLLQVAFVLTIEDEVYVIHARPLTKRERAEYTA